MGANVDECDERGSTALMTAAQWGHVESVDCYSSAART